MMPGMDRFRVGRTIKSEPALAHARLVLLTSSDSAAMARLRMKPVSPHI